jgi:hypothetical protein
VQRSLQFFAEQLQAPQRVDPIRWMAPPKQKTGLLNPLPGRYAVRRSTMRQEAISTNNVPGLAASKGKLKTIAST